MSTERYQRLEKVIQWTELSRHAFAMRLGMKRSENLYRIMRNKENVSAKFISLILSTFQEINPDWLIYGRGEMLIESEKKVNVNMIPIYGRDGYTPLSNFATTIFNDADRAVMMLDDSMVGLIPLGALVILKKSSSQMILYGQSYYIQTREFSIIRVIRKSKSSDDELILEPVNSQRYDTIVLKRKEVLNSFLVCGAISSFSL